MNRAFAFAARSVCAALLTYVGLAVVPAAAAAQHGGFWSPDEPGTVRVSERDVDATVVEAGEAYQDLVRVWASELRRVGVRFAPPRLVRYRGAMRTRCGFLGPSNANYCLNSNTIYFDDVFLAAQAKLASDALGTDGDMVPVGIIAHEMGHAVAFQLGHVSRDTYRNEATADCLAGAFTYYANRDGELQVGDIDEALFGMAEAGDPTLESTGDPRRDARMNARLSRAAHGTREQRVANFKMGLEGGGGACLDELR